ncbi:MAG: hypothetical protein WC399_00085 [Bacilli bacterium]|jgi:hypothetical protein
MNKPSLKTIQKLYAGIKGSKAKYLTAEALSHQIGLLPETIQEAAAFFNPIATMDYSFDLKELLPDLETFLKGAGKSVNEKKNTEATKKPLPYANVVEFVYDKMTFDGIVDKSHVLSDPDLRLLKRIAAEELRIRRLARKKK